MCLYSVVVAPPPHEKSQSPQDPHSAQVAENINKTENPSKDAKDQAENYANCDTVQNAKLCKVQQYTI